MVQAPDLICTDIVVEFGAARVLRNVSFALKSQTIVGLLGPNGSGKTTLLNVLSGHLAPNKGSARFGRKITGRSRESLAKQGIFRSFQDGSLFESLTGRENVAAAIRPVTNEGVVAAFVSSGHSNADIADRQNTIIDAALDAVGAGDERDTPARQMSFGMRKRTILAQTIVFHPTLCLLDEPLAGADQTSHGLMMQTINKLRTSRGAVLWVEHDYEALRLVVDRLLVLDQGRIVADGRPDEILASGIVHDIYFTPT